MQIIVKTEAVKASYRYSSHIIADLLPKMFFKTDGFGRKGALAVPI